MALALGLFMAGVFAVCTMKASAWPVLIVVFVGVLWIYNVAREGR